MNAPIFISFSSKDIQVAEALVARLAERHLQCWISSQHVHPGENYQEAIVRAIRSAKIMLFVFSSNTNNSDEVKKELSLASRLKLVVMPLRVENVEPNDALLFEFSTRQWIDLFDEWQKGFERLVVQINKTLAAQTEASVLAGLAQGGVTAQANVPEPAGNRTSGAHSGMAGVLHGRGRVIALAGLGILAFVTAGVLLRPRYPVDTLPPAQIGPAGLTNDPVPGGQRTAVSQQQMPTIAGVWVGWHECLGARIATTIRLVAGDHGQISGTEAFYAAKDDPNRKAGKLTVVANYDGNLRQLSIEPKGWIIHPQDHPSCGLVGSLSVDGTMFTGKMADCSCGNFELHRQ
jgi:hypothetical protein